MKKLNKALRVLLIFAFIPLISTNTVRVNTLEQKVYIFINNYNFDIFSWMSRAGWEKIIQSAISSPEYITPGNQKRIVQENFQIISDTQKINSQINSIYANPSITNHEIASKELRDELAKKNARLSQISPITESILQVQVTEILKELDLTEFGQPIPDVLYKETALPQNLVISRRDKIGIETNFILTPLEVTEASTLENKLDKKLNISSLVVDIGGLAAYPTMIMRTSDQEWLIQTIAHEWTHLYLAQRPLGANYTTPELRTMNETTASIAGTEIMQQVMGKFYPELVTKQTNIAKKAELTPNTNFSTFNFRKEMNITRIQTDQLLTEGNISEAEDYMELRRKIFWENGYLIRKINQAYFAFHGSYADTPGGAAGEDPVGPAVRKLRDKSSSLKSFLETISRMTSFSELENVVEQQ